MTHVWNRVTFGIFFLSGFGCSMAPVDSSWNRQFAKSNQPIAVERTWTKKLQNTVTDLQVAGAPVIVLGSSLPGELYAWNENGDELMHRSFDLPIKTTALDPEGAFWIAQDYRGDWSFGKISGELLWKKKLRGSPKFLKTRKHIVQFHDDEPFPKLGFEVLNYEGKTIKSWPVQSDPLSLRFSADEKWMVLSQVGGKVQVFNDQYHLVHQYSVDGEILDILCTAGDKSLVYVLAMSRKKGQQVYVFKQDQAPKVWDLAIHAEQMEILSGGDRIALYGNGPKGQALALYSPLLGELNWQRVHPHYAEYTLPIRTTEDSIFVGYEEWEREAQFSNLYILDLEGKLRAEVPLKNERGSFLYTLDVKNNYLAVSTDDNQIQLIRVKTGD